MTFTLWPLIPPWAFVHFPHATIADRWPESDAPKGPLTEPSDPITHVEFPEDEDSEAELVPPTLSTPIPIPNATAIVAVCR